MAVKHYYCGKVCFNCIITVQNIKTYFNQSHKLLAIHTFVQYKFGHTVSETSLELQQFCLLLLHCETYYIISGLVQRHTWSINQMSMVWYLHIPGSSVFPGQQHFKGAGDIFSALKFLPFTFYLTSLSHLVCEG